MAFKVYTRTGDKGKTGLIGGTRVPKYHLRIEAYGTIDELNSYIGLIRSSKVDESILTWVAEIQDRLFTVGSILATDANKQTQTKLPDLHDSDVTWLEDIIDSMDESLEPMKYFVLPGGDLAAAHAHVARCICRRAERLCVQMMDEHIDIPPVVLKYLNRLSDCLFVMARYILAKNGGTDIPWHPRVQ